MALQGCTGLIDARGRGTGRKNRSRPWMLLLLLALGCSRHPAVVLETASGGATRVRVEVVNDPASRQQGLMYRRELGADAGMLFVFPQEQIHYFWMKNTFIPLDMIFIAADGRVVGVVENARPFSTDSVGVDEPSRYVLEVNGGFAARHGVRGGIRARFENVPDAAG